MSGTTTRFFTESFKARSRLVAGVAVVLASASPFAVGLAIITYLVDDSMGPWAAVVTAAAFLAAGGFTWIVQNRLALMGNRWLRARLWEQVAEREERRRCDGEEVFVGFGPGDGALVWSGETDLDVGFLCTGDDALIFLGDRFNWSLGRDRIDRIDLTSAPGGPRRIVIHWHAPREPGRAFTLESREARSLREVDAATVSLFRRLRAWSLSQATTGEQSPALGYPPTDPHDGQALDEPAPGWCAVTLAMVVIVVLTIWHLAGEMLAEGYYYHAVLWAGFVFVGGAVFTRCLLNYLHNSGPPPRRRQPRPRS